MPVAMTWGIITLALASIFFYQYVASGANGELHHILPCSEPYIVMPTILRYLLSVPLRF